MQKLINNNNTQLCMFNKLHYLQMPRTTAKPSVYLHIAAILRNTGVGVPSSKNAIGQGARKQILASNDADNLVVVVHNTKETQTKCAVKTIRTLEK